MKTIYIDATKVLNKFEDLENIDTGVTNRALVKAAALVEGQAKKNVASTTHGNGELANSITSVVYDTYAEVGTNKKYAVYVHQGTGLFAREGNGRTHDLPWHYQDAEGNWHSTSGQHPNPFLERALDENADKITQIFREEIRKET